MANKLYVKDGMNFEGISMQEGRSSSTLKLLGFMLVTAIVLGLLIFTAGSYISGKENQPSDVPQVTILPTSSRNPTVTPEVTQEEKVTPTVTPRVSGKPTSTPAQKLSPTESVKAGTVKIQILNGSGIKGAAGKMSTALTDAGYTVVNTGNADSFTYKGITVNIKKSKSTTLSQLKKDLSTNGYLVTSSTTTLSETSSADAVIIIGTE